MKTQGTDRLIADVLAMSLEVRQHLDDGRRQLTPLQIEALSNAISSMADYFAAWKAHELESRQERRKEKGPKFGSVGAL